WSPSQAAVYFLGIRSVCDDYRVVTNRNRRAPALVGLVALFVSGCVAPVEPKAVQTPRQPEPITVSAPPEWRPGDQWVYTWTSGQTGGTTSVEVLASLEINKGPFYIVKVGALEQ